ncbi:thermonuclease family protein [Mangrovibacterium diazotrophicum]|uniref:Micrococcal nuclease n=1 Tax=Mangrovibacterium diazotrophicum TaxID=1261403 RepID=A0A419VWP7_9BACT|nr:thermonuclease family protein [Mangrovibacterium diazotrophicum]RKD86496.1 micrococcal nuclease [Mangrovibacterium diazotrophicum]
MYQYQAEIVKVVDGDTYEIDIDLGLSVWVRGERIRLYGVNTPEVYGVKHDSEEYLAGKAASDFVKSIMKKGTLAIVETLKDSKGKYGRYLAVMYVQIAPEVLDGYSNIRSIGDYYCINDLLIAKELAEPYFL